MVAPEKLDAGEQDGHDQDHARSQLPRGDHPQRAVVVHQRRPLVAVGPSPLPARLKVLVQQTDGQHAMQHRVLRGREPQHHAGPKGTVELAAELRGHLAAEIVQPPDRRIGQAAGRRRRDGRRGRVQEVMPREAADRRLGVGAIPSAVSTAGTRRKGLVALYPSFSVAEISGSVL